MPRNGFTPAELSFRQRRDTRRTALIAFLGYPTGINRRPELGGSIYLDGQHRYWPGYEHRMLENVMDALPAVSAEDIPRPLPLTDAERAEFERENLFARIRAGEQYTDAENEEHARACEAEDATECH